MDIQENALKGTKLPISSSYSAFLSFLCFTSCYVSLNYLNKQTQTGGYYSSCSQMFGLASGARLPWQAGAPGARAEDQDVVRRRDVNSGGVFLFSQGPH